MVTPHEAEINLDAYARVAVALGRAGMRRDAVLASHGLDETGWGKIEDQWQARLSEALDAVGEDETTGVPVFVGAYEQAMARAQAQGEGGEEPGVMPFETFVEATRAAKKGADLGRALERLGVGVDAYLRANRHYTQAMIEDDALAKRFWREVGGAK